MIKSRKFKLYSVLGAILLILLVGMFSVNNNKDDRVESLLRVLDTSEKSIVFLELAPNGDGLYLSKKQHSLDRYGLLKKRMKREGWTYIRYEGSSLFFKKGNRQLIVETKIWRSHYIEYDVQHNAANIAD